jgi:hypothetical protein
VKISAQGCFVNWDFEKLSLGLDLISMSMGYARSSAYSETKPKEKWRWVVVALVRCLERVQGV